MTESKIEYKEVKHELVTMGNRKLISIRGVSDEEAEIIIKANFLIHKFYDFLRKFQEVELNYEDYWRTVERYKTLLDQDLAGETIGFDYREKSFVDINRAYNNYVSSVKSFTELCRAKIKKKYGENSEQDNQFQQLVGGLYDENVSYRLILKTRDFALHSKFPIQSIVFIDEQEKKIEVAYSRDIFLENGAMKKALKEDLEKLPPYFEVKPYIEEMPALLEIVLKNCLRLLKDEYEEAVKIILSIEKEAGTDKVGINIPDYSTYGKVINDTKVIPVYMAKKFNDVLK